MRGDEHGAGRVRSPQPGHDVVDLAERRQPRRGPGADRALDLHLQPRRAQLPRQVGLGALARGAADGPRFGGEPFQVHQRALGAELLARGAGRQGLHGAVGHERQHDHHGQGEHGRQSGRQASSDVEQFSDHDEVR
ncbi:hypothetical protein ACFWYW_29055 [Nonomuraea sp. NPDC059023]|uniref:hypothetical protein n=1 Tax=Nonomuraea sp. NPDC059023 TaxID=3346706 RepID=UPI0036B22D3B